MNAEHADVAARLLHGECSLRISALNHRNLDYYHCRVPGNSGRVSCYHHLTEPPEGSVPTAAQQALYDALGEPAAPAGRPTPSTNGAES